jgi:flavorubredoxin
MAQSLLEVFTVADPFREWTVREMAEWCGIGGRGPVLVGSPATVADLLESWVEQTDVDGFNLFYASMPGTYEDVVNLLVPELQKRGRYKTAYRSGTHREKSFFGEARSSPNTLWLAVSLPLGRIYPTLLSKKYAAGAGSRRLVVDAERH